MSIDWGHSVAFFLKVNGVALFLFVWSDADLLNIFDLEWVENTISKNFY